MTAAATAQDAAAGTQASTDALSKAALAAAPLDENGLPPPLTGLALEEHAERAWRFYHETLGSPKHVAAPMVRVPRHCIVPGIITSIDRGSN